jgi:hypothetical protein
MLRRLVMSETDKNDRYFWQVASGALLLMIGLALVALSLAWPRLSDGSSTWTNEKAEAYQAASAEVHQRTMQMAATPPEEQTRANKEALADAQTTYAGLRAELDDARTRPARLATILRFGGILLAISGAIILWMFRETSTSAS